jgi:hypothetical protein
VASGIAPTGWLHLDDIGAIVGEELAAVGTGNQLAQLDNPDTV